MHANLWLNLLLFLSIWAVTGGVVVWLLYRPERRDQRSLERLRDLAAPDERPEPPAPTWGGLRALLERIGQYLVPAEGPRRQHLQARLALAGVHGPQALRLYRSVALFLPVVLGTIALIGPTLLSWTPSRTWMAGAVGLCIGLLAPGLWLDQKKKRRQAIYRHSLP